ncbi:restriction endonuclease subunit S [Aliarcobacter cryaerophilus]|uniref:restriction endonuclease subunit S n=1 Tax=Aliarcobacter cryaerophilus TaxID=28198 RepID=UPI003DA53E92
MSNLPKGWEEVKLGEILNIQTGKKNAQDSKENGEYPFFTRSIDTQKIDTYSFDTEALFIAGEGNFTVKYYKGKFDLHQRTYMLTALKENTVDLKFLQNNIQPKVYQLVATSVGSTVQSLRKPIIEALKIPLPPLEEQKKIANILSTVDKKIAFVEENINATEELKKGLMQKLLTEGIGHTDFKDSELGKIPESWEVKSIGSLTSLTAGGTPSTQIKDYWNPKEVPWLSSGEVNKKIINFTDNMISKQGLNNSAAKFIPKYSVLIALAGQGKTRGTVAISEIELTTNQSVASILPSEKLDMYFIYYNLDSRYEEIRSMSTGVGGRGGLNLAILKSIKIALPPQKEQKQIAEILSTVDKKLENLKEKKQSFEELKKGLMQKLLTGEVRV